MTAQRVICLALVLVVGTTLLLSSPACSDTILMQALKIFGIGYVVSKFGGDINDFINNLADQRGVKWEGATKVVPIVSVGQGGFIGAAQVAGEPSRVDKVKAVGQVEAAISSFRGKLLVPVNTTKPSKDLEKVPGVGVSGLIDFEI
jgi:hypothetical protein